MVTGGGRGIGRAIALACAEEGASVAITARSEDQLAAVVEEIHAAGGSAVALVCDVGNLGQVEGMVRGAVKALGGIDILVNNAGGGTEHAPVAESTPDLWVACISANLIGTYACTRLCLAADDCRQWRQDHQYRFRHGPRSARWYFVVCHGEGGSVDVYKVPLAGGVATRH